MSLVDAQSGGVEVQCSYDRFGHFPPGYANSYDSLRTLVIGGKKVLIIVILSFLSLVRRLKDPSYTVCSS